MACLGLLREYHEFLFLTYIHILKICKQGIPPLAITKTQYAYMHSL